MHLVRRPAASRAAFVAVGLLLAVVALPGAGGVPATRGPAADPPTGADGPAVVRDDLAGAPEPRTNGPEPGDREPGDREPGDREPGDREPGVSATGPDASDSGDDTESGEAEFTVVADRNAAVPGALVRVSFVALDPIASISACSVRFGAAPAVGCRPTVTGWSAVLAVPRTARPGRHRLDWTLSYPDDGVQEPRSGRIAFRVLPPPRAAGEPAFSVVADTDAGPPDSVVRVRFAAVTTGARITACDAVLAPGAAAGGAATAAAAAGPVRCRGSVVDLTVPGSPGPASVRWTVSYARIGGAPGRATGTLRFTVSAPLAPAIAADDPGGAGPRRRSGPAAGVLATGVLVAGLAVAAVLLAGNRTVLLAAGRLVGRTRVRRRQPRRASGVSVRAGGAPPEATVRAVGARPASTVRVIVHDSAVEPTVVLTTGVRKDRQ